MNDHKNSIIAPFLKTLLLVPLAFFVVSCETTNMTLPDSIKVNTIAITAEPSDLISQSFVESIFSEALIRKGYILPSRKDMDLLLQEIKIQRSSFTENKAAELGKMINADAMLIASVPSSTVRKNSSTNKPYLAEAIVSVRLIEISTGRVIWTGSRKYRSDIFSGLGTYAKNPANNSPFDILTDAGGNKLGPKFRELAKSFPERNQ